MQVGVFLDSVEVPFIPGYKCIGLYFQITFNLEYHYFELSSYEDERGRHWSVKPLPDKLNIRDSYTPVYVRVVAGCPEVGADGHKLSTIKRSLR